MFLQSVRNATALGRAANVLSKALRHVQGSDVLRGTGVREPFQVFWDTNPAESGRCTAAVHGGLAERRLCPRKPRLRTAPPSLTVT